VSIILVNWNGIDHLPPCLDSIAALDYPAHLVETILIDNASTDGSQALLSSIYPWVTVLQQQENLGFAPAVNLGVAAATTPYVAFVNNDMRLDPQWLRALAARLDSANGVHCVAGTILNWEGTHLDFGSGAVNFHGFGEQPNSGQLIEEATIVDGSTQPFACGGSMLVDRQMFLDLGGFDPKFFAYFEDVDFGIRLQVAGYRTVLAADARSFHRHHGTSARFRWHERMVLLERNALRILIKNVSDEHLPRLLAGALLLQTERAAFDARSDRTEFEIGQGTDEMTTIHRLGLSRMHAVNDIVADLPELLQLRAAVQAKRQRADVDVFSTFGLPLTPMGNGSDGYATAFRRVVDFLDIDKVFVDAPARHVVVLCHDLIGPRMAGTAIRAWEIACSLAQHARVTVASDRPVERSFPGVDTLLIEGELGQQALEQLVGQADVVVVFGFDLIRYPFIASSTALRVVDLYDPWIFGSLEQYDGMSTSQANATKNHEVNALNQLIDVGDLFICASERQRDFWMGMLASRGRLDKASHDLDPHLRKLIDLVPFGVPARPPLLLEPGLLKGGAFPSITAETLVIVWGGGTWDWFDPIGVLDAFNRVSPEFPNARLFFMGLELEGRGVPTMAMSGLVIQRARELGMIDDGRVVLGPWVPYDDRGAFLREADIGVVAAKAMAETRLAFRTRVLDHFWAGLPTLATAGDVLADTIATSGAGVVVPPNDLEALTDGLRRLLGDSQLRRSASEAAFGLAEQFHWTEVVKPIVSLIHRPGPYRASRPQR
jgi:GT2 family glycosyltransferase